MQEIIVDMFAGGGGATEGIEKALRVFVAKIGNSVCPPIAEAIVKMNVRLLENKLEKTA